MRTERFTCEIKLTQGKVALVDCEDFDWLNQWKWHAHKTPKTFYACRTDWSVKKMIRMHALICGDGADHKNLNGLDNRRSNLRKATRSQQGGNRPANKNNKSGFKGVSWSKRGNRWYAYITKDRRVRFLGAFHSKIDAARAYDDAAKEAFGEFAFLNFGGIK